MIINHNMSALFANRQLEFVTTDTDKSIRALASGMRINQAGDDASGLAVSEKMRSQIRGLNAATKNAQNGISFIQASEGYLGETQDILQRMRELSIQASNGIYSDEDRGLIQKEVNQLIDEVDRIASHAEFNKMNMMTGRFGKQANAQTMAFHVGANVDQRIQVYLGTMTATALGIKSSSGTQTDAVSISTVNKANQSLGRVDQAIGKVVAQRAELGAYQNRMEHIVRGLSIAAENTVAAESRIRDTDMAAQMVEYVKNQILTQSGASMLASANTKSQVVMKLLG
ncbi:MAG: flagellin [Spirochaetes bacterium]|nr:flagellin [Spirochaetota bacterium]